MAFFVTQIDRTVGNYQDIFLYTLNVSFNGIEEAVSSAKIEFFVPDICTIYLGDLEYPVQEVRTEVVEGGTQYTIDFGKLEDTGIAVRIGFGVAFGLAASSGAQYAFTPTMWVNDAQVAKEPSAPITLSVTPRFEVRKEVVLPTADPAAGGVVYYLVTLQNFGDLGAEVREVAIQASAAEGLTIDPDFAIVGFDDSSAGFEDISMDGVTGRVVGNTVYFDLASYRGEIYRFLYRAQLADTLESGEERNTEIRWQIETVAQSSEGHTLTLGEPTETVSLSLYAPDYTMPNQEIAYEWRAANTGNQVLKNTTFRVNLSQDVQYTSFRTGTFQMRALDELLDTEYQIYYTTQKGVSGLLGVYNADSNTTISLNNVLADGDNLQRLEWRFDTLRIGVSQKTTPRILGVVRDNVIEGSVLKNEVQAEWQMGGTAGETEIYRSVGRETLVQNVSVLQPSLSSSVGTAPVRPGDVIRYTMRASAYRSHLNQPIFAVLLPNELTYLGEERFNMSSIFGDTTPPLPPVQVTENFNAAGDTLLLYAFRDAYAYDFTQMAGLTLSFEAGVNVGAKGKFEVSTLLNVAEGRGEIGGNATAYEDVNNIAQDASISTTYAQSNINKTQILFFVATSTQKRVRGLLDEDFVAIGGVGQTLSGGEVVYEITVRNIGNADLQTVEIVDILPYVGDTGVVDITTARKSAFSVSLTGEAVAQIVVTERNGEPSGEVAQPVRDSVPLTISYSQNTDPVRFGGNFDRIGQVDDWQDVAPDNMLSVRAVKVGVGEPLLPGQSLVVQCKGFAPIGLAPDGTAWNSFAAQVTYDDLAGERQALLATESRKAGVKVLPLPSNRGEISGCVWFDDNKNGVPNATERAIEDVGVVLYNAKGVPLQVAFTAPTQDGRNGCYAFGNLPFGRYYVKFFLDDNQYQFTRQNLSVSSGSKPNRRTGVTPVIVVSKGARYQTANAGLINQDKYQISDILAVNRSARSMMRHVVYNQMLIGMKQDEVLALLDGMMP